MGNEMLFKLVVPAIFLILWALNQLFNKEATAPTEKAPVPGPRPGGLPPAPRPRPSSESSGRRAENDEIIIIRAETSPNRPPARPGSAARRPARGRPAPAPGPRRPAEPTSSAQSLGGLAPTGVAQTIDRPLDLRPLSGPLSGPLSTSMPAATAGPLLIGVAPIPTSADLLRALTDRARVREALLLNEILGPPVALRGRKPTRPEGR